MIIADNETAVDLLYYEAIAATIVQLIETADGEPLTVGVHGDWGAGKSSVLLMLENAFAEDEQTLCIRFNGWLFQGFEDTKAVLIETIIEQLRRERSAIKDKAQRLLKRVDWMKVARKMGGLAFNAATGLPTLEQANGVVAAAKTLIGKDAALDADDIKSFVTNAGNILKDAEPETIPTQVHAFRKEFIELLKQADIGRLIVVVDDLDRCLPEIAIETLEAIRLFLFVPGAAFIIAADEAMIEYAVKRHFPDLPLTSDSTSYARNYLEKLIQVPFRLPPLGYVETRTFVTLLISRLHLDRDDPNFAKLVELTREVLRRPWGGDGFTREKIDEKLGEVPSAIEKALQIADQIAPLLTEGARGNPRQIKRFLNTMELRLAIAEQRAIASDVNLPVLAKLMLAERFEAKLFAKIESEAAESGKSSTIEQLEQIVRGEPAKSLNGRRRGNGKRPMAASRNRGAQETDDDKPGFNEWERRWAALDPSLREHDLRPYLLISRDRKAVFSATLSRMEEWIDKLCSSRLGARAAASEIAKVPPSEAEEIFNALAARVRSAEDFKTKPDGIDGIAELCKVHKSLQEPTVSFLASIPTGKLGAWVVSGWEQAITEEGPQQKFQALQSRWAEQEENKVLKTAASVSKRN